MTPEESGLKLETVVRILKLFNDDKVIDSLFKLYGYRTIIQAIGPGPLLGELAYRLGEKRAVKELTQVIGEERAVKELAQTIGKKRLLQIIEEWS